MSDLKDTKFTGMKEIIRLYVVDRFAKEPRLEKEWDTKLKFRAGDKETEGQRSLDDLVGYLYCEAAKLPREGNCTAVEDKVVFGWVNHYLEEEGREVVSNRNAPTAHTQEDNATEPEKKEETKPTTTTKPTAEKKPKKEKKKVEEQGTQLALFSML